MAFSLSNWFKGKPEDGSPDTQVENGEAPPPAAGPADRSEALAPKVRVTGRISPRVVRTVLPQAPPATLRAPSARQAISLPVAPGAEAAEPMGRAMAAPPPSSRKISFGTSADPTTASFGEPPRVASASPAPAPAGPDVKVVLEVGDFIDRLPSSLLQAGTLDRQRKVEFQSSELYSDLTRGRATVPASTIYQKCADIFSRPITATEDIEVVLPLQKLVEQMSGAFQTRRDQVAVESVGEIETPFLQVAQEDNARLPKAAGTSAGPIAPPPGVAVDPESSDTLFREHHRTGPISTITPPKGAPDAALPPAMPSAGAPANLKRPPSTVRASVAGAKIRISGPAAPTRMKPVGNTPAGGPGSAEVAEAPSQNPAIPAQASVSPSHQVTKKTARIQIPPISLRAAGAPPKAGSAAPPVLPTQPGTATLRPAPAPAPEAAPTFRSTPGGGNSGAATFRSTPPPAVKPPPPSFAPRRTNRVPPAAPAPLPGIPAPGAPAGGTPPLADTVRPVTPADPADDREIVLRLGEVLRALPAAFLTGDPAGVPDDASLTLPFRLIAPQLASGRVTIAFGAFLEAMPAEYRSLLDGEAELPEVPLPLPEIFQNLPASALSIRADQVIEETGSGYLTPFSQKAEEDAKRFGLDEAAAAEPVAEAPAEEAVQATIAPEPAPDIESEALTALRVAPGQLVEAAEDDPVPTAIFAEEISPVLPSAQAPATEVASEEQKPAALPAATALAAPVRDEPKPIVAPAPDVPRPVPASHAGSAAETALQKLFMTEDELDAKAVVKLVSQLPGINGCTVMFGDGLRLAGNFPENGHAEGFSAMSPPFYKRTMNFASELKLGALQAFTIYTETGLLSFFMHDDICMSVRHAGRGFLPGVREKLETVTRELAQMYSAPSASVAN